MDDGGKVEVERSDGFTNGQERNLLLTAPLDGSSRFEFAVELTVNGHAISIPTLVGRRYVVEVSSDLIQFSEVNSVKGTGALQVIVLGPIGNAQFYRVRVEFAN